MKAVERKSDLKLDLIDFEEDFDESRSYPMGILYISAYLKRNGFTNIGYAYHILLMREIEEAMREQEEAVSQATQEKDKLPPYRFLESPKDIKERRENNLILSGSRRIRCLIKLGWNTIPCIVQPVSKPALSIIEHNRYRKKTPVEIYNESQMLKKIYSEKTQVGRPPKNGDKPDTIFSR